MKKKDNRPERYKCAPNVSWRRVASEVVVLDLKTSDYFSLNETAALAWESLVAGATVDEAAEALVRRYKVAPEDAGRHVKTLLQKLLKQKTLVPRAGAPASGLERAPSRAAKPGAKLAYVLPAIVAMGLLDAAAPHPAAALPSPL